MKLNELQIDRTWTLFLDRDGVINKKIDNDYVRHWSDFEFLPGTLAALEKLKGIFGRIIVITNQRGIAKGLYTEVQLHSIHEQMLHEIRESGGRVDGIFYCPHMGDEPQCNCRKPETGMAFQAQEAFPEIDFQKSIVVGDSISDIGFGKRLGMKTVLISNSRNLNIAEFYCNSLAEFAVSIAE